MKKLIIIILLIIGFIPISCLKGSCRGENFKGYKDFRILRFDIATTDINGSIIESEDYYPEDSIFKQLFILEKRDVAQLKPESFSFATPLYACSPPEEYSVNFISDINFISKNNFTDSGITVSVGENITDKFEFIKYSGNFVPVVPMYYAERIMMFEKFYFKSNINPTENLELKFDLIISMSDGAKHEFKDQVLRIK